MCLRRELDPLQLVVQGFCLNPCDGLRLTQNEDAGPVLQKHRETLCCSSQYLRNTQQHLDFFVHCSNCHGSADSCILFMNVKVSLIPTQDVPLFLMSRGLSH